MTKHKVMFKGREVTEGSVLYVASREGVQMAHVAEVQDDGWPVVRFREKLHFSESDEMILDEFKSKLVFWIEKHAHAVFRHLVLQKKLFSAFMRTRRAFNAGFIPTEAATEGMIRDLEAIFGKLEDNDDQA